MSEHNPKILFIRHKKPPTIKEGGELATEQNYNLLKKIVSDENIEQYIVCSEKQNFFSKISSFIRILKNQYLGLSSKKLKEILALSESKDIVFIDRSIHGIIAKYLKENGYKGKVITFFHNVETVFYGMRLSKFAVYKPLIIRCIDNNDRYAVTFSDKIIALHQRDSMLLQKLYGKAADILIPITLNDDIEIVDNGQPISKQPVCLFLGANYPGNTRGVLWFYENVYPHIDLTMRIIGKNMDTIRSKIGDPKVDILSNVKDITPYLIDADLMIMPIFEGSGMKVKVCEALKFGKYIIGTKEAFEGYDFDVDEVGACCNSAEDFIRAINKIAQEKRMRFNAYSRDFFVKNHRPEVVLGKMETLLKLTIKN